MHPAWITGLGGLYAKTIRRDELAMGGHWEFWPILLDQPFGVQLSAGKPQHRHELGDLAEQRNLRGHGAVAVDIVLSCTVATLGGNGAHR